MSDIKLVYCKVCGEWHELNKIEHKNGQAVCRECGRPKESEDK